MTWWLLGWLSFPTMKAGPQIRINSIQFPSSTSWNGWFGPPILNEQTLDENCRKHQNIAENCLDLGLPATRKACEFKIQNFVMCITHPHNSELMSEWTTSIVYSYMIIYGGMTPSAVPLCQTSVSRTCGRQCASVRSPWEVSFKPGLVHRTTVKLSQNVDCLKTIHFNGQPGL